MDEEGISMEAFKDAFEKGNMFASGIAVNYGASLVVAKAGDAAKQGDGTDVNVGDNEHRIVSDQELATNIKVGMRMPSFKVLNQADARPWHFQELLKSNGRWRIVVFAGDIRDSKQKAKVDKLGERLGAEDSFLARYTPERQKYDSVIEVLTVHSSPRQETTIFDFMPAFRPWDGSDGWDYWKIFVDDQSYHEGHGQAYENYGMDPKEGCAVILRPDQYVSWVGDIEYDSMERFFGGFMREQKKHIGAIGNESALNGTAVKDEASENGMKAGEDATAGVGGQ